MNSTHDWPFLCKDQTGRSVIINKVPKRIISLVPSQSEYLWDIGLKEELVGITKFCIHPRIMFQTKARVGGTKQLNMDIIHQLKPDLIIGNKEENTFEDIQALQPEYPVWLSNIETIDDALMMMHSLASITGKQMSYQTLRHKIDEALDLTRNYFKGIHVAYAIWKEPWMFVGKDTYINSVLNHLGFVNVLEELSRYPVLTLEQLKQYSPQVLILSGEPFPFQETHANEVQEVISNCKVVCFSGEPFSWYGSRMIKFYEEILAFERLMH